MKRAEIKREVKRFKKSFFRSMRNSEADSSIPELIFKETVEIVNHLVDLGLDTASAIRAELNTLTV